MKFNRLVSFMQNLNETRNENVPMQYTEVFTASKIKMKQKTKEKTKNKKINENGGTKYKSMFLGKHTKNRLTPAVLLYKSWV